MNCKLRKITLVKVGTRKHFMKVPVCAISKCQHRFVLRRERFFVEPRHSTLHLSHVSMRGPRMTSIVHQRLRNKPNLIFPCYSITKIPVFADLHSRIESADIVESLSADRSRTGTGHDCPFPKQQIVG